LYYIQETDKPNFIFKVFSIIELKEDKIILPIQKEILDEKNANKISKKIMKILNKTNCKKIVLSKEVKKQELLVNKLYSNQIDIVDGKWLFEVMMYDVVKFIINKKNLEPKNTQISITANTISENVIQNLYLLVKEFKKVNVVTNHLEKFKNIEKGLLEEQGVMITFTNNKKKSLAKSNIILNVDFPKELLNKYNINDEAIIVNIQGNMKIDKKRFNGLTINDYEIEFKKEDFDFEKQNKYYNKDVYEAKTFKKQPFKETISQIHKDNVRISELIGNNVTIHSK